MKLNLESVQEALGSDFQLIRELGGAGMSRVYQARDLKLGRDVVVKVLPPDLASTKSTARFEREIAVTTQLQHPNIIPILETGYVDRSPYYLSPYIKGENLRQMIERDGALSMEMIHTVISDICSALEFAHKSGVVHRDIKPANILISQGRAILADFGVARFYGDNLLTQTDSIPGTLAYQAPERPNDATCDLYALAVVAHEMFSGSRPNLQISVNRMRRKRRKRGKNVSFLRELAVASVIAKALSMDPKARFLSAAALSSAFREPSAHAMLQLARGIVSPAALFVGVCALGLSAFSQYESGRVVLVEDRYAIAPLHVTPTSSSARANNISDRFEGALGKWQHLQIARIDQQTAVVSEPIDLRKAFARSRDIGASSLVISELQGTEGALKLRATMWDVKTRSPRWTFVELIRNDSSAIDESLAHLASAVLRGTNTHIPAVGTNSLHAWQKFDAGQDAESHLDLKRAAQLYTEALGFDRSLASANLALARVQTLEDSPATTSSRIAAIERTVRLAASLDTNELLEANALFALLHNDFLSACAKFTEVGLRNKSSIIAAIGSGDCRALDRFVESSPTSGAKYFRTEFADAVDSYETALNLANTSPQEFIFKRIQRVLPTEENRLRSGIDADGRQYLAYMSDHGDSFSYRPFPVSQIGSIIPQSAKKSRSRNLARLRILSLNWVRNEPSNSLAHETLGEVLEAEGTLAENGGNDVNAIEEIRTARRLTPESGRKVNLIRTEIRQLLKSGNFKGARAVADSTLKRTDSESAQWADALASIAATVGRVAVVSQALELAASTPRQQIAVAGTLVEITGPLARKRASIYAELIMGVCDARLAANLDELKSMLAASGITARNEKDIEQAVLIAPLSSATVCLGYGPLAQIAPTKDRLGALQQRFAVGGAAAIKRDLESAEQTLHKFSSTIPFEQVLGEAQLMVQIGDSARALRHLEFALNALSGTASSTLSRPAHFAGLARSFALSAELAKALGQDLLAIRRATAFMNLWSDADPRVADDVRQVRIIATGNAR